MTGRSIRWRLLISGAVAIAIALALAGVGLAFLFERHVERVAIADLEDRSLAVAALIEGRSGGVPMLRDVPIDPLYEQPFSGHYWQMSLNGTLQRSRSLWDFELALPQDPPAPGATRALTLDGPRGASLLVLDRSLLVGSGPNAAAVRIAIATDRAELVVARRAFLSDLAPYLGLLGVALLVASAVQVAVGLRPLSLIGARIAALGSGTSRRIGDDLPAEVTPLATEIDALLDARDAELARARHRAGDLAHGFKTPLQALQGEVARLRARDAGDIADSIEAIAMAMHRHTSRELARVRIQSGHAAARCDPGDVVARLVGVLRRTPKGGDVDWQIEVQDDTEARIDSGDLTEALGALMENALRFASTRITVTVTASARMVIIDVTDDGPGAPEADLAKLTGRGVRLDQSGDGQGIGLAIVAEIMEAAGGSLDFRNLHPGLSARLIVQRAPSPAAAPSRA